MLMLSKKIAVVVFSILSISISALPNVKNVKSDNEIITPGIMGNIETEKTEAINFLSSFDDAVISIEEDTISYSSTIPTKEFYSIDYLADGAPDNGLKLKYDVFYLMILDLMYFDVSVLNENEEILEKETLYGYPFVNEDGETDVKLDIHGTTGYASEILGDDWMENNAIPSNTSKMYLAANAYSGNNNTLYPIVSISKAISTLDGAIGLSASFINVPTLFDDGPLDCLYYELKLRIARSDYEVNSQQAKPAGLINDQKNYTNWKFGLDLFGFDNGGTVAGAGCECIAIYNLLYDSGAEPDLATIIALVELCNADLFLGVFGANPIPDEVKEHYRNLFLPIFDFVVVPLIEFALPVIINAILVTCLSSDTVPWWFKTILGLNYAYAYSYTAAIIQTSLVVAIANADLFFDWYFDSHHGYSDVLALLIGDHSLISRGSLSSFQSSFESKRQGIVSFWNKTFDNGFPNFGGQLHTVYVRKNQTSSSGTNQFEYEVFNLTCKGKESKTYDTISDILKYANNLLNYPSNQFIWGYLLVE